MMVYLLIATVTFFTLLIASAIHNWRKPSPYKVTWLFRAGYFTVLAVAAVTWPLLLFLLIFMSYWRLSETVENRIRAKVR